MVGTALALEMDMTLDAASLSLREQIAQLARDVGTVSTVADRRKLFDSPREEQEHRQMLQVLNDWRSRLLDVLARLPVEGETMCECGHPESVHETKEYRGDKSRACTVCHAAACSNFAASQPAETLNVEVVVNGQPITLTIPASCHVRDVIEPALKKTATLTRPEQEWEVRLAEGAVISLDQPIQPYAGQRLWINLRAGYAASQPAETRCESALRKLAHEVSGILGIIEPQMREAAGHTNVNILIQRLADAKALLPPTEKGADA